MSEPETDPPVEDPSDTPRSSSLTLRRALPWVFGVIVLAVGVWLVVRNWDNLSQTLRQMGWRSILLSGLLALLGTAAVERIWSRLLTGSGARLHGRAAWSTFYVTQLGKYIPGSVWPILAQMELGRRSGLSRRVMLSANVLMMAVVAATGLTVGALLLPWSSPDGLRQYWWVYLFLLPLLAALHPRVIPALLDRGLRILGREPSETRVSTGALVRGVLWGLAMWLGLGLHVYVMVRAVGGSGTGALASSIGGMALAFAAGLLVPFAPAGAGIRDSILILVLAPQVGNVDALAIAVASRTLLVIVDVLLAAAGAALRGSVPLVPAGPETQTD